MKSEKRTEKEDQRNRTDLLKNKLKILGRK